MINITGIGADPELFVALADDEKVVSAIGLVGGTKTAPKSLGVDGFFVQEDNVLAEFNIPPAKTAEELASNIGQGLALLNVHLGKDYRVIAKASHIFDDSQLDHPKAQGFGCDPDIIAWTEEEHVAAPPGYGLRTSSGHFHFGYDNPTYDMNFKLAKAFDIFHGLPSVILDPDRIRRQLYGQAGAFRHKEYGLEYRTLSSFWISDPKLCNWVFKQAQEAAKFVDAGEVDKIDFIDAYEIQAAINYYDVNLAKKLMEKYNISLP